MIIGADVQYHRKGVSRADAAAGGVQRKFTDRNPHAADPLIAQTENTFSVGNHNHFDVMVRHILQDIVHVVTILIRDENAARTTINLREAFAGRTDSWRVDNRHHLIEMVFNQAVEQRFVGILNVA